MRNLATLIVAFCMLLLGSLPQVSQAKDKPPADAKQQTSEAVLDLPPLPDNATVSQSIQLDGRSLDYKATVGWLPVRDDEGRLVGQVVYTAYTVPGKNRPVTFAFNGGPGASSVYLNLGAIGPKVVDFGDAGDAPSDPATLHDNAGTWLDFTDLVFIDPVGTGYSRALVDDDKATELFFSTETDIHYLSRIIYDWLVRNGRMQSPKYLVGESYGGFRGPRITLYLQTRLGVAMSGVVLVSPYLDPAAYGDRFVSPLPWMLTLPSITAAHLERQGKLSRAAMRKVVEYTRTTYAATLMKGHSDPQAYAAMIDKVTHLTGLDPEFVRQSGGRISTRAYLRESHRDQGKIGSIYDSNVTTWDPFPYSPRQMSGDPLLNTIIAPTTEAMVHFVTQTVGWEYYGRYHALNYKVNRLWHEDENADQGSVRQLRKAVANDRDMQVLITHGWNDLSCPFMVSELAVDQMPVMDEPDRVRVINYPGGHMFYTRKSSRMALRADVRQMIAGE